MKHDNMQRLVREALRSSGFLSINKKLIQQLGLEVAVYIGNMADKHEYFERNGMLQKDGAFFLTHESQLEQTGLGERALQRCKVKCRELGFIVGTEMRGVPAKEHYIVDFSALESLLVGDVVPQLDPRKVPQLDPSKAPQLINENKLNENKETSVREKTLRRTKAPTNKNSSIVDRIVEQWNTAAESSGLPKVTKLTQSRRTKLTARSREYEWKQIRLAIRKIHQSEFCRGNNDNSWRATIDFLARPDSIAKALEGLYDGQQRRAGRKRIIARDGNDIVTEDGEPMRTDKWFPVLDEDTEGRPFPNGERLWEGPDGTFVLCDRYPDPHGTGKLVAGCEPVDPKLFGLHR